MTDVIVLPGIGNSGPGHWQTIWESENPSWTRFRPSNWNNPVLYDWLGALSQAVEAANGPPVLLAHSLSCLLVAHWSTIRDHQIKGAFLVSVPDPRSECFPKEAVAFEDLPDTRFDFPAVVVASANDPFGSPGYSKDLANLWGARHISVGEHGHINAASNLGDWAEGQKLFNEFYGSL